MRPTTGCIPRSDPFSHKCNLPRVYAALRIGYRSRTAAKTHQERPIFRPTLLAAVAALAALNAAAAPPFSNCRVVKDGVYPGGFILGTATHFPVLQDVFKRISAAAKLRPSLYLCEGTVPQAAAMSAPSGPGLILVNDALLRLSNGDADELAAVIGHEFGHLVHRHREKKQAVATTLVKDFARTAAKAGDDEGRAAALETFADQLTSFSRAAESEADDEGFSLARDAGFAASGQRRIAEKMVKRQAPGTSENDYLKTHPGWEKRLVYSALLERNEEHRVRAADAHKRKDAKALGQAVDAWKRDVPGSGAAAYYDGVRMQLAGESHERVAAQFEQAVMLYAGESGLSRAGQRYQAESSDANIALCASLHKQGRMAEAAFCAQTLRTKEEAALLKEITGWEGYVWMPRPRSRDEGNLYVGRMATDKVMLTNCQAVADQEALVAARRWRAAPKIDMAKRNDGYEVMACSPNFCECQPLKRNEMPPEGWKVVSD